MESQEQFSSVASLLAEPARATLLWNLSDGRAYTAGELAILSDISPQSASNHLSKLVEANFLSMERQGKHRYYRFAREEVAYAVEAMANLIPGKNRVKEQPVITNGSIQYGRTCYDHLAGKIAVTLTQSLLKQRILKLKDKEFMLSLKGRKWFEAIGLDIPELEKSHRYFAKPCLDWTERKFHLAGALGAGLLNHMRKSNWIRPKAHSRIVILTTKGESELTRLGVL